MINKIISCEFNIDTVCVDVKLTDGSMVSIDCIAVENEYANNMYETSELDFLIYNEPMSYVRLLLSGKMEEYLRNSTDYTPLSDMRYNAESSPAQNRRAFWYQLNDGGSTFVSENGLLFGEGSDILKYILAAFVVPKS